MTQDFHDYHIFKAPKKLSESQLKKFNKIKSELIKNQIPEQVKILLARIFQCYRSSVHMFKVDKEKNIISFYARGHKVRYGEILSGYRKLDLDEFCVFLTIKKRIKF